MYPPCHPCMYLSIDDSKPDSSHIGNGHYYRRPPDQQSKWNLQARRPLASRRSWKPRGDRPTPSGRGRPLNTDRGHFGDPLQVAAFGGGLETVELLLDNDAVINTQHGEYGNALVPAAHRGHVEVAKKLLASGVDPELSSGKYGKALAGAAASGQADLVRLLLVRGNDINDANESTGSALYCASKLGDAQLVRMLIRAGADPNTTSGELHTALGHVTRDMPTSSKSCWPTVRTSIFSVASWIRPSRLASTTAISGYTAGPPRPRRRHESPGRTLPFASPLCHLQGEVESCRDSP